MLFGWWVIFSTAGTDVVCCAGMSGSDVAVLLELLHTVYIYTDHSMRYTYLLIHLIYLKLVTSLKVKAAVKIGETFVELVSEGSSSVLSHAILRLSRLYRHCSAYCCKPCNTLKSYL